LAAVGQGNDILSRLRLNPLPASLKTNELLEEHPTLFGTAVASTLPGGSFGLMSEVVKVDYEKRMEDKFGGFDIRAVGRVVD